MNFPNYQLSENRFIPIVSPGIEVEDSKLDKKTIWASITDYEDVDYVLVDEYDAINSKCPLFVISYNSEQDISLYNQKLMKDYSYNNKVEDLSSSKSNYFKLKVSKLQINYRYDNTNKSEVNMKMIAVSSNKTLTSLFMGKHKLIYDYPKAEIGNELTINTFLFTSYSYWDGSEEFFFNIYERDWYASEKLILKSYSNYLGEPIYLYGKMNHSTDWYYICPTSTNYPKKFYDYPNNSSIVYSTSKSKLTLYKYE